MSKATGQVGGSRAAPFGCEEKEGVCGEDRSAVVDAQDGAPSPQAFTSAIQRFTCYRRNLSQRGTHTELQRNADDEPQFEGVIWTDGTVTLRWLTACRSHSVWDSVADCLNIHGHPEYGTVIEWHDAPPPAAWLIQLAAYRDGGGTPSTGALSSSPQASQNTPSQPAKAEGRPTTETSNG